MNRAGPGSPGEMSNFKAKAGPAILKSFFV